MAFPNISDMMKNAQMLQEKMQKMQENFASESFIGEAGGGLVRVTLKGQNAMQKVEIDASLLKPEEKDIVEDLICAAFDDANRKATRALQDKMQELTGGLGLPPGMKLPF